MPRSDVPAPDWLSSYLDLLGLDRQPPSFEYLRQLTRAHLNRVPFENITSILRRAGAGTSAVPPLDREAELQAWLQRRSGGLCFEVVDMFGALLAGLGFECRPVLATISFVGSHQALVVTFEDELYLVDAGNGAPFFEPIPLARADRAFEVSHVGLGYRFRPASNQPNAWVQDRCIDGTWEPFCTYDLRAASAADRETAYQRHHLVDQSWVVDNLTLVRCTDMDVWSLRGDHLTRFSPSGKTVSQVDSPEAYRRLADDVFGLPNAPIEAALEVLRLRSLS